MKNCLNQLLHGQFYIDSFHEILAHKPISLMYLLIDPMTFDQCTLDLCNSDNVVLHCRSSYFVASDTKSLLDSVVSALIIFSIFLESDWTVFYNWARIYLRLTFFQNHPLMHDIVASATVWSVISTQWNVMRYFINTFHEIIIITSTIIIYLLLMINFVILDCIL